MTKNELKERLIREGVPEFLYSLSATTPNEAFVLHQNGDKWEVYYGERGYKRDLQIFDNESDACENIYPKIKDYASEL